MIEYITGTITSLNAASVVIETRGGVGYILYITLQSFEALQDKTEARLLVHETIREDAWTLYGFITEREREMFRALIGVSGVGSATAIIILSAFPIDELERIISSGDDKRLKKVKGIGQKTAQRIIVDLRDKITPTVDATDSESSAYMSDAYEEALVALVTLGFQKQASQVVLKKLFEADPTLKVEAAIKKSLAML